MNNNSFISSINAYEQKLSKSENKFKLIFEQAAVGICYTGLNGNFLKINDKFCDIVGYTREELKGMTFKEITYIEDLQKDLQLFNKTFTGDLNAYEMEKRYVKKDSSIVWVNLTVSVSRDENLMPEYFIGAIVDITEKKLQDRAIKKLNEELERRVEERTEELKKTLEELKKGEMERKIAEQHTLEAYQFNKKVIDCSPIGIFTFNSQGQCVSVNDEAARISGGEKEYLLSQNFTKSEIWRKYKLYDSAIKTLKTGEEERLSVNMITTFGNNVWIDCKFLQFIMKDEPHLLLLINDITRQKIMEDEISLFFNTTLDMLCIADFDGYFKRLSPTWSKILGWSNEELYSRPSIDFVHEGDRENTSMVTKALTSGGQVVKLENRYLCKDGTYKWLSWNSYGYVDRNIIISAARDITESKRAEEILRDAKEIAENADKAKSEFLANMSHEIRTPLNAILGFSELLYSEEKDAKHKDYIESINIAGNSLLNIINDILDLSKIEAGMMKIQLMPINPRKIFEEIERIFHMKISQKGLIFYIEIDDEIPDTLLLDEIRLRQVLLNIVGNSVKFTDKGYIHLSMKKHYSSSINKDKINIVISVEDTGIGIPESDLKTIFESFKQQQGQNNRKYGGTGLGLSISKRLMEMMNGELMVRSDVGKGSVFTALIKDIDVTGLSPINECRNKKNNGQAIFENKKVLIVDDVQSNRKLLKKILEGVGLQVVVAENRLKALKIFSEEKLDLIIMDIMMPEMNGMESPVKIRSSLGNPSIPILALTDIVKLKVDKNIDNVEFDGVIYKPVNFSKLLEEIKKFIPLAKNEIKEKNSCITSTNDIIISPSIAKDLIENISPYIVRLKIAVRGNLVEELSELLIALGEKNKIHYLYKKGMDLKEAVEYFDIIKINTYVIQVENWINTLTQGSGYM